MGDGPGACNQLQMFLVGNLVRFPDANFLSLKRQREKE